MADSANVSSFDTIKDARAALVRFIEEGKNALSDVEFEIRRALEWVGNEQRLHWASELRRRQQQLAQAKSDLHRKKLGKFFDHHPDTSAEEDALALAKRRLAEAEHKIEVVRRWSIELPRAVEEYRSSSNSMLSMLDVDLERAVTLLDRMLDSLDAYIRVAPPSSSGPGKAAGLTAASGMATPAAERTEQAEPNRSPREEAEPGKNANESDAQAEPAPAEPSEEPSDERGSQ